MSWIVLFVLLAPPILALALWRASRAQKPIRCNGSDDPEENEEWLDLHDPRVPDEVRRHAESFLDPVRYVVLCGPDILLLTEDGEVVDICALR